MPIWQLCANLLIPNCLRSNLSYSPLAALELYVNRNIPLFFSSFINRIAWILSNLSLVTTFFANFGRILSFSLYKGSLGDWRKMGLRIGDRSQFHILLWNALNEHPMMCHQPFYDPSSGVMVIILSERTKSIHFFLFWACSSLTKHIAAFLWHSPGKCVLGYVLLLK